MRTGRFHKHWLPQGSYCAVTCLSEPEGLVTGIILKSHNMTLSGLSPRAAKKLVVVVKTQGMKAMAGTVRGLSPLSATIQSQHNARHTHSNFATHFMWLRCFSKHLDVLLNATQCENKVAWHLRCWARWHGILTAGHGLICAVAAKIPACVCVCVCVCVIPKQTLHTGLPSGAFRTTFHFYAVTDRFKLSLFRKNIDHCQFEKNKQKQNRLTLALQVPDMPTDHLFLPNTSANRMNLPPLPEKERQTPEELTVGKRYDKTMDPSDPSAESG